MVLEDTAGSASSYACFVKTYQKSGSMEKFLTFSSLSNVVEVHDIYHSNWYSYITSKGGNLLPVAAWLQIPSVANLIFIMVSSVKPDLIATELWSLPS